MIKKLLTGVVLSASIAIGALLPINSYAVINGSTVTVDGSTTCNNGVTERTVAGTMTTTCGSGWSVGSLPPAVPVSASPLHFSDLISGPATGLGDGNGSGVIVTVWGQNLGSTQGSSTIQYCDSTNTCRTPYVYYWKNADGTLPGGPANLYESHNMQEIAFSIPAGSASGLGTIRTTVAGEVGELPFTVRAGNIYHVKPTGNDTTGDGSFAKPFLTPEKAQSVAGGFAGSTIYIHDILTGSKTTTYALEIDDGGGNNTLAAQFGIASYPNTRAEFWGQYGVRGWNGGNPVTGIVTSKLSVFASNNDEDGNGQPVNQVMSSTWGLWGASDGRSVGNYVTDTHPTDTAGGCPTGFSAAIVGNNLSGDKVSNWKVFGNQIKDYGCPGTNRQQHTMYFSIRDNTGTFNKPAPEVAYNYLKDNKAAGGVRYFDEDLSGNNNCGQFSTTFKAHHNVVVNQAGEGIGVGANCTVSTTFEFYNNVLINTGLKSEYNDSVPSVTGAHTDAVYIQPGVAQTSDLYFYNNTIHSWNTDGSTNGTRSCVGFSSANNVVDIFWNDNICYAVADTPFIDSNYEGDALEGRMSGGGNVWYTTATSPTLAIPPTWDATKITADPLLTVNGSQITVGAGSPIIDQSSTTIVYNIDGEPRELTSNVGSK